MLIHELKSENRNKRAKRIGRGGKRGTFSGRGSKGQKSHGKIPPDFRGGNAPLWKVFPKVRGAGKKTKKHHRFFRFQPRPVADINLDRIERVFKEGETVSPESLVQHGLVRIVYGTKIKVLGRGMLNKKLKFSGLIFSQSAKEKVLKSGAEILNSEPTIKN